MTTLFEHEIQTRVDQELQRISADPVMIITLCQKTIERQAVQIKEMLPKAEAYDILMGAENLVEMSAVAKALNFKGMGRNNLFEYLRHKKVLRFNNEPYQTLTDRGYFKVIPIPYTQNGATKTGLKTMITMKGIDFIKGLLIEDGYELNPR